LLLISLERQISYVDSHWHIPVKSWRLLGLIASGACNNATDAGRTNAAGSNVTREV
jgi:hypothetical protein